MGTVLYWIAVVPLFLVVVVFAVSNHQSTALSLWPVLTEPVPFPVYGIALVGLFVGFVTGGVVAWFQHGRTRHRVRDLQRQSEAEQRELASLRERVARLQLDERQATIPPLPLSAGTPVSSQAPVSGPAATVSA